MSDLPRSSKTAFPIIKEIISLGWIDLPDQFQGTGAPGNTLEYLCDVKVNNNDSPDLMDWEMKFHGGTSLLTLFHKEPKPRGTINKMVNEFGWDTDNGEISFRYTLKGNSDLFEVANENDTIIVKNKIESPIIPYWEHNILLTIFGAKLRRLIVINGKVNKHDRKVIYESAVAYWDPDIINICNAITNGKIAIDFDAKARNGRGSSVRNHGTKFRIQANDIASIYGNSYSI